MPSWVREQCKASIIAILMKDGIYCEQGILVSGFCLSLSFCRYWFSGDDATSQNDSSKFAANDDYRKYMASGWNSSNLISEMTQLKVEKN